MTSRTAYLAILVACVSCSKIEISERPPDCDDESLKEIVVNTLTDDLYNSHARAAGYPSLLLIEEPATRALARLWGLNEEDKLTETGKEHLRILSSAFEETRQATATIEGIRRESLDEIALKCTCSAVLHIDGSRATEIQYWGQYDLEGRLWARSWGHDLDEIVTFLKDRD